MNEQSTDEIRARFMRALAVAEKVTASSPIQRWDTVAVQSDEIRVTLHHRPEDVAEWARLHGLEMKLNCSYIKGRPHLSATGSVEGVRVEAYALGDAGEQERYAACMPVVEESAPGVESLPSAWSVTAVSA